MHWLNGNAPCGRGGEGAKRLIADGPMERCGYPLPPGVPSSELGAGDEWLAKSLVMQVTAMLWFASAYSIKHHKVELSL